MFCSQKMCYNEAAFLEPHKVGIPIQQTERQQTDFSNTVFHTKP